MKNCPNCGAPIDYEKNKCSYCGTGYYDLSCMTVGKPFFMRINVPDYGTIVAKAILKDPRFNAEVSFCDCDVDSVPKHTISFRRDYSITADLSFDLIPFENKIMEVHTNEPY